MEKFILTSNSGKGFITHEDQEIDGLKFRCFDSDIVKVIGDEDKVIAWMNRVFGSEMVKAEAMVIIMAKEKIGKLERIKELKAELVILEEDVQ